MRTFRNLATAGALIAYALALLGSWTRINGAGMTCPDWPLCRGAVVPVLHGGVVFEWTHRALAGVETLVVIATIAAGWRLGKQIPGLRGLLVALAAIFVLQIALGGITIFQANSPLSVTFHWGVAMLLLTTFTVLVIVALAAQQGLAWVFALRRGTVWVGIAAIVAYATMCAGALVSSSGAGLACPVFPSCGDTFWGQGIPQTLQMTHRLLAATLVAFALAAALALPPRTPAATALRVALALLALQVVLGVLNVRFALPPLLREAHAANAVATFVAFLTATVLSALAPSGEPTARAQSRSRLQPN